MSGIEELVRDEPEVLSPEEEERGRKKARDFISDALISAGTPIDNRGVKQRLLPGLWYATITVLINILTPEETLDFLRSRYQMVVGYGDNADSPPRKFDDKEMQLYVKQVAMAAETIMEKLMVALERMEELDIDDRFPETVFDVALKVLLPAWGPDHVRRAITEQCAQLIKGMPTGRVEINNFMEPRSFVSPPQKPKRLRVAEPVEPAVEKAIAEFRVRRQASERTVACFAATERLDDGRASWAITMRIASNSGRTERRDVYGSIEDKTGNKIIPKLVHELALALCLEESHATVDIKLTDYAIQRCLPDQTDTPADYLKFEEAAWTDVQACFAKHAITSRVVAMTLSDDQQERCDKLLKNPDQ